MGPPLFRRALLLGLLLASPAGAAAAPDGYASLRELLSPAPGARREAARLLIDARDPSLVPGLVDAYFFLPRERRGEALSVLVALTGERPGERYHDWVELVGRRADLEAKPGYLEWKAELLSRIDPRYREILYGGAPVRLRAEEIVWGGVKVEGIPALDRPAGVPAARAGYLEGSEKVFGVSLGGEQRAYPLRILDWHEMVNDEVGGEPVTLSYCTLCGSAVLYSTRAAAGPPHTFGTSGLLYRSNKLMIDRRTGSLWSNLTGEPVLGRLAGGTLRLPVLPLTLTTWKEWRARHPRTTVLAFDEAAGRRWGYDYRPGAADRRRAGVSFPAGPVSPALGAKDEIFAVRLGTEAKAYPVAAVLRQRVINDDLAGQPLVLVADPESGAVRAYRRGGRRFAPGPGPADLADAEGRIWSAGEDALAPLRAEDGPPLERVPGHRAFWFGWQAFFPRSELYEGPQGAEGRKGPGGRRR